MSLDVPAPGSAGMAVVDRVETTVEHAPRPARGEPLLPDGRPLYRMRLAELRTALRPIMGAVDPSHGASDLIRAYVAHIAAQQPKVDKWPA